MSQAQLFFSICFAISATLPGNAASARAFDLFDFGSASGYAPDAGIIVDGKGVLYGTTPIGGNGSCLGGAGCGTVYSLSPPDSHRGNWSLSVLHNFQNNGDGVSPTAPLVIDPFGALYGYSSGSPGTVFQLTSGGNGSRAFAVIYTFTGGKDGNLLDVSAPLIATRDAVYGVASGGSDACGQSGCGSVFRLKQQADGSWREKTLYSFTGGDDGGEPTWIAGPDSAGALYVSTRYGNGAVSQIVRRLNGGWFQTAIAHFDGQKINTPTNLLLSSNGVVFGTANNGAHGIVFQLAPQKPGNHGWSRVTVASISDHGYGPTSLALLDDGSLIGAIEGDFDFFAGAIFQLKPPISGNQWTFTQLWNFNRGPDRNPLNVLPGRGEHLYGVMQGGDSTTGSLFELR